MVLMGQTHGNNVFVVGKHDDGKTIKNCDGLVTNTKGISLGVRVADCLPIAIYDLKREVMGLVHAGWRGLENGIIQNILFLMKKEFETNSKDVTVFIGPHICQKHYEVKSDVSGKFKKYPSAVLEAKGKIFLDLGEIAKQQLMDLGVPAKNIKGDQDCTFENKNLFSYRRGDLKKRNLYLLNI